MIHINFNVQEYTTGFQLIDALYAFYQSQSESGTVPYRFSTTTSYDPAADFNVLCLYMPDQTYDGLDRYDMILVNNSCEPLLVSTPTMHEWILTKSNCYFISNSFLSTDHRYFDKVIWWPDNVMEVGNLWTQHFYPTLYQNLSRVNSEKTSDIIYINGRNDAWRNHVISLLEEHDSSIKIRSGLGHNIYKVNDSQFESSEDQDFRDWVNEKYDSTVEKENFTENYYNKSTEAGIDGKFGSIPPGYFILDEYFIYRCVIFPESTWQNSEVAITEKTLKCFYAKSIPWPVGGANINKLYNDIGFFTAWNLLPDHMQQWDSIESHRERHLQMVQAMIWLEQNTHVLRSDEAKQMVNSNFEKFLLCQTDLTSVERFSKLIQSMIATRS